MRVMMNDMRFSVPLLALEFTFFSPSFGACRVCGRGWVDGDELN